MITTIAEASRATGVPRQTLHNLLQAGGLREFEREGDDGRTLLETDGLLDACRRRVRTNLRSKWARQPGASRAEVRKPDPVQQGLNRLHFRMLDLGVPPDVSREWLGEVVTLVSDALEGRLDA